MVQLILNYMFHAVLSCTILANMMHLLNLGCMNVGNLMDFLMAERYQMDFVEYAENWY